MNRRPVTSANVASVGWEPSEDDEHRGTLEVEFRSGHTYRYADVPQTEYLAFVGADSVGQYFRRKIAGNYREDRVA